MGRERRRKEEKKRKIIDDEWRKVEKIRIWEEKEAEKE